jgi:hypothetical protein
MLIGGNCFDEVRAHFAVTRPAATEGVANSSERVFSASFPCREIGMEGFGNVRKVVGDEIERVV